MNFYRKLSVWTVLLVAALLSAPTTSAQLSTAGQLLWEENLDTEEQDSLRWPVAAACRDPEEIAVLDAYNPRLLIYTRTGNLDPWKISQSLPLPAAPADIVFDGERYLVALRGIGEILVYADPDSPPDRLALPPGVVPSGLAANQDGTLVVIDAAGERVLRLDRSGAVSSEIATIGLASGLATEARGSVLVAHSHPPVIQRYGANNEMVSEWQVPAADPAPAWPTSLAVGDDGNIVISDRSGGRLYVLDRNGNAIGPASRKGWKAGSLLRPLDVSACPGRRFVVTDVGTARISIFRQVDVD